MKILAPLKATPQTRTLSLPQHDVLAGHRVVESFFGALIAQGVRDVVVSPGARSQALALAALEWEDLGELNVHVVIDEEARRFGRSGCRWSHKSPLCVLRHRALHRHTITRR